MSRILKRPMFRKGGSPNKGIMTGLVDRKQYAKGIDKEEIAKNVGVLEEVLREYTPPVKIPYGAFGLDIATGTPVLDAFKKRYGQFTTADDKREAAIKGGAAKIGITKALEGKKGFRILSEAEKSSIPGVDMKKTYQIDLGTNKISVLSGTGTNVTVNNPRPETQEEKEQGKVFGKEFGSIVEAGNLANTNDQKLEILRSINNIETLKTGKLGELRTEVQKLGETFGLDLNLQDTTPAEIVTGISGGLVLDGLQKFTGAISDGERNYTKSITPGLSMTREGNEYLLQIASRQNELAKGFSSFANNWVSQNGGLSKRNPDGMTWGQAKTEWHKENPLINPEIKEKLNELSKQVDTEFASNIIPFEGKQYIYHRGENGKVYYNILK